MGPLAQSLEELRAHFEAQGAWDIDALIDRRQGRVKIKYLDYDWTLNRLEMQR